MFSSFCYGEDLFAGGYVVCFYEVAMEGHGGPLLRWCL